MKRQTMSVSEQATAALLCAGIAAITLMFTPSSRRARTDRARIGGAPYHSDAREVGPASGEEPSHFSIPFQHTLRPAGFAHSIQTTRISVESGGPGEYIVFVHFAANQPAEAILQADADFDQSFEDVVWEMVLERLAALGFDPAALTKYGPAGRLGSDAHLGIMAGVSENMASSFMDAWRRVQTRRAEAMRESNTLKRVGRAMKRARVDLEGVLHSPSGLMPAKQLRSMLSAEDAPVVMRKYPPDADGPSSSSGPVEATYDVFVPATGRVLRGVLASTSRGAVRTAIETFEARSYDA